MEKEIELLQCARKATSWRLELNICRKVQSTLSDKGGFLDMANGGTSDDKEVHRESSVYDIWGCIHASNQESFHTFQDTRLS